MLGCCFRADHASLHGTVSTPAAAAAADAAASASSGGRGGGGMGSVWSSVLQVLDPHRIGSPQHGRSVSDSRRAIPSSMIGIGGGGGGDFSGGGVGMRRPERFEGQLAQGWVEQTEEERALQNALPKLRGKDHTWSTSLFLIRRSLAKLTDHLSKPDSWTDHRCRRPWQHR